MHRPFFVFRLLLKLKSDSIFIMASTSSSNGSGGAWYHDFTRWCVVCPPSMARSRPSDVAFGVWSVQDSEQQNAVAQLPSRLFINSANYSSPPPAPKCPRYKWWPRLMQLLLFLSSTNSLQPRLHHFLKALLIVMLLNGQILYTLFDLSVHVSKTALCSRLKSILFHNTSFHMSSEKV